MNKTLTRYGASVIIAMSAPSPEALDREVNLMYNYGMLSRQNEKKGTGGIPADYIPGVSRNVTVRGTWEKFIPGLRARVEAQMMNGIDRHTLRPRKLAWNQEVDRRVQDLLATFERDNTEMESQGLSEVFV
jgi:hypothetical protein